MGGGGSREQVSRSHVLCERRKSNTIQLLHNVARQAGVGPLLQGRERRFYAGCRGFSANVTSLTLRSFAKSGSIVWNGVPSVFTRRSTGLDGEQHATGFHAPFSQNHLRLLLLFFFFFSFFTSCFSLPLALLGEKYWYVTARLTKVFSSFPKQICSCHRMGRSVQSSDTTSALKIKLVIHRGCLLREGLFCDDR